MSCLDFYSCKLFDLSETAGLQDFPWDFFFTMFGSRTPCGGDYEIERPLKIRTI